MEWTDAPIASFIHNFKCAKPMRIEYTVEMVPNLMAEAPLKSHLFHKLFRKNMRHAVFTDSPSLGMDQASFLRVTSQIILVGKSVISSVPSYIYHFNLYWPSSALSQSNANAGFLGHL